MRRSTAGRARTGAIGALVPDVPNEVGASKILRATTEGACQKIHRRFRMFVMARFSRLVFAIPRDAVEIHKIEM